MTIATEAPTDVAMIQALESELDDRVVLDIVYSDAASIDHAISYFYRSNEGLDQALSYIPESDKETSVQKEAPKQAVDPQEAPVVNLVQLIIEQAVLSEASDIHVCPMKDESLVRIRVDGELQEIKSYPI